MPHKDAERRQYIRLNSYFPVEFSLIFLDAQKPSIKYQGFTHDVSKGGLCIRVKDLKSTDLQALLNNEAKLQVHISISPPLFKKPVSAVCKTEWLEKTQNTQGSTLCPSGTLHPSGTLYSIGVSYEYISAQDLNRILLRARSMVWAPRLAAVIVVVLLSSLLTVYTMQDKARQQNQILIKELVEASQKQNEVFKKLNNLNQAKIFLEKRLSISADKIKQLAEEISKAPDPELSRQLEAVKHKNLYLAGKLENINKGALSLEKKLENINTKSAYLEQANIEKMKDWVLIHRNRKSGLVLSYEGDNAYKDWAFTYDQALAVQAFLLFGDAEKAKAILDFYSDKAETENDLFYNAYDAQTSACVEYNIHSGPNMWLAMAACRFIKHTNNAKYLKLAEAVADKMISMQNGSQDKGIRGGPSISWVSTEHNMDAYALFNMLYDITGKEKYKTAGDAALMWLKESAYNKPQSRFNRGKGDATIATDTFSWAIAAIGPKVLQENGMDPDAIMEFAETECKVRTQFFRPDGKSIEVTGFDFSKAQNVGRGGVISCEWTAQMIVAFEIMANYHKQKGDVNKAAEYSKKAKYYLIQLTKMVISSPSPSGQGQGCLPYASIDNVDTGHGWRAPKGHSTGSVAATIYYIFAYSNYNPLEL